MLSFSFLTLTDPPAALDLPDRTAPGPAFRPAFRSVNLTYVRSHFHRSGYPQISGFGLPSVMMYRLPFFFVPGSPLFAFADPVAALDLIDRPAMGLALG